MRVKRSPTKIKKSKKFSLHVSSKVTSITIQEMGWGRGINKKKAFMDLYSMLLCFHLQSSNNKMKESEHKNRHTK